MSVVDERGFWINKSGEARHPDLIPVDEKLKDELLEELLNKAKEKQQILAEFKKEAYEDINSYYELLLQKYNMDKKPKTIRGNFTIENFSGTKKVSVTVSDSIKFDEKLTIAKMKIDEYLHEITQNASPDLKTLVLKAFEVDKKGDVNVQKIMALKSYEIEHPTWLEAMKIIDDATQVVSSKSYIRFYEREGLESSYKQVSLDFSKVGE